MGSDMTRDRQDGNQPLVCPWQIVGTFDNVLRPLIHSPKRLFGQYVKPGMTVMDLGCGAGFASLGLARLVGDGGLVISADVQPEMLEMVRKRAARSGLSSTIRTHLCEHNCIGLDTELDFALAFWMIHEVPDTPAYLREVFEALKLGGIFYVAEPWIHTSRKALDRIVEEATRIGFLVLDRPRAFFSRAVVLAKPL